MNYQKLAEELLNILESSGVEIRKDSLNGSGGGLCKLKDKVIFFYDTDSNWFESTVQLKDAVNEYCDLENIYVKPYVRDYLKKDAF